MVRVLWGRHIDYTPATESGTVIGPCSGTASGVLNGRPVAVYLPTAVCLDDVGVVSGLPTHARHSDFALPPYPTAETGIVCCDAISSNRLDSGGCFHLGITDYVIARTYNVAHCHSANDSSGIRLWYSSGVLGGSGTAFSGSFSSGCWVGRIAHLRGGNLDLKFCCNSGELSGSLVKFDLHMRGCKSGIERAPNDCIDPLKISFEMIEGVATCCDCVRTTEIPTLQIDIEANCPRVVWGRHIDYGTDKTPIVAVETCPEPPQAVGCNRMQCGLVATVTAIDADCDCLETGNDYELDFSSGSWVYMGGWQCNGLQTGSLEMSCVYNNCQEGPRTVTLTLSLVCGADNVGGDSVTILEEDLDDLDVTFELDLTDASSGSCSNCVYQYNEMTATWTLLSGCTGGDSCGECGEEPSNPPASPTDGQIVERLCPSGGGPECCIGTIQIRVMR